MFVGACKAGTRRKFTNLDRNQRFIDQLIEGCIKGPENQQNDAPAVKTGAGIEQ
jgi:hypothetical protein